MNYFKFYEFKVRDKKWYPLNIVKRKLYSRFNLTVLYIAIKNSLFWVFSDNTNDGLLERQKIVVNC